MKYRVKNEALAGTYTPFQVGPQEIVLTGIHVPDSAPGDRIQLKLEIGWSKPAYLDLAELEVLLREDTVDGPVLYWTQESCMIKARFIETVTLTAAGGSKIFYLTVRSMEERALISGTYSLQVTVDTQ
ncbi:hypothetical protein FHS18_002301 [Paenibacillus phyllosphaerae]|uniref:Uncharacterized protein n=1 Tax=Paenibacillus phyllosphaerae TaxID=274593 RepID=A0A7W5FMQ1_9BACL|nr:hypothetical protein [Paenibacillus phyllosphaerae]MBB3110234.1 hypothetical protein [Paenibacillus phyllosphaerae]